MMAPIEFWVHGAPVGQPRAKAAHRGGFTKMYDPGTADHWKAQIMLAMRACPESILMDTVSAPLRVDLTFYFPRPKSHFHTGKTKLGQLRSDAPKWHTKKPDRDNSDKAVLDALTVLGIWTDDCFVCDGRIQKRYANAAPGCLIKISEAL